MGMEGSYELRLTCDHERHRKDPWTYADQMTGGPYHASSHAAAVRAARADGWVISYVGAPTGGSGGSGRALCPMHSGKRRAPTPATGPTEGDE